MESLFHFELNNLSPPALYFVNLNVQQLHLSAAQITAYMPEQNTAARWILLTKKKNFNKEN